MIAFLLKIGHSGAHTCEEKGRCQQGVCVCQGREGGRRGEEEYEAGEEEAGAQDLKGDPD